MRNWTKSHSKLRRQQGFHRSDHQSRGHHSRGCYHLRGPIFRGGYRSRPQSSFPGSAVSKDHAPVRWRRSHWQRSSAVVFERGEGERPFHVSGLGKAGDMTSLSQDCKSPQASDSHSNKWPRQSPASSAAAERLCWRIYPPDLGPQLHWRLMALPTRVAGVTGRRSLAVDSDPPPRICPPLSDRRTLETGVMHHLPCHFQGAPSQRLRPKVARIKIASRGKRCPPFVVRVQISHL